MSVILTACSTLSRGRPIEILLSLHCLGVIKTLINNSYNWMPNHTCDKNCAVDRRLVACHVLTVGIQVCCQTATDFIPFLHSSSHDLCDKPLHLVLVAFKGSCPFVLPSAPTWFYYPWGLADPLYRILVLRFVEPMGHWVGCYYMILITSHQELLPLPSPPRWTSLTKILLSSSLNSPASKPSRNFPSIYCPIYYFGAFYIHFSSWLIFHVFPTTHWPLSITGDCTLCSLISTRAPSSLAGVQ